MVHKKGGIIIVRKDCVVVIGVKPGTQAEKVGIKEEDLIIEYDGKKITADVHNFLYLVEKTEAKEIVTMKVERNGEVLSFQVAGGKFGVSIRSPEGSLNGHNNSESDTVNFHYRTLLAYGKFISGFGWLVVLLGVIGLIVGIASGRNEGLILSGGGFIAMLMGIGLIISGQLTSCFVSIERNTRQTYELLRQEK